MLQTLQNKANPVMLFIAVPLVVMSFHVFMFFETDPIIVRVGLAVSFDVLIIVLFHLIEDELIKKKKQAIRACWMCISVLIAFQLYVNIWVYWEEVTPVRAIVSGSIFPLLVGPISYIASLRAMEMQKKTNRTVRKASAPQPQKEQPWKDVNVPREEVEKATNIETFKGARNWKSVKRWFEEKGKS